MKKIQPLLPILLIIFILPVTNCQNTYRTEAFTYIDSLKINRGQYEFGRYGEGVFADWTVINQSNQALDGWEIEVRIITSDESVVNGLFFQHGISMMPNDTIYSPRHRMYYRDNDDILPFFSSSPDSGILAWDILQARGLIIR